MDAYVRLLIKTCHARGVAAMYVPFNGSGRIDTGRSLIHFLDRGGMSAQIPIKNDDKRNQAAMDKVRADKKREVSAGHDGTWCVLKNCLS